MKSSSSSKNASPEKKNNRSNKKEKVFQEELFSREELQQEDRQARSSRTHSSTAVNDLIQSAAQELSGKKRKRSANRKKRKKVSPKVKEHRKELVRFVSISLILIVLSAVIVLLILNQGSSYETAVVATAEGEFQVINGEGIFPDEVEVFIEKGLRAEEVCSILEEAGVVRSSSKLQEYLVSRQYDTRVKSGLIILPYQMRIEDAAEALVRGYWNHPAVTVYKGFTLEQIDNLLASQGLAEPGDFLREAEITAAEWKLSFAEGYFYPETYRLEGVEHAAEVLADMMIDRFFHVAGSFEREVESNGRTLEETVIVASMIQRETANTEEMDEISGIIWKRLDEGIPLGIDATTRYELRDWSTPLTRENLNAVTPYNTRRKKGLPPTAIANPGLEALDAAAFPTVTPYYYYLHDAHGVIHFAETYKEHLANVEQYLN